MTEVQCSKPATIKQQLTHAARLRHMLSHSASLRDTPSSERYLCEEHADLIDKDWIMVQAVNHGDVASVLAWADKQCEYVEDTENREVCMNCVFNKHEQCDRGNCRCSRCRP